MRLVVVTVADVGGSDEEFKRVVLVQIQCASFNLLLQLSHALLPIAASDILDISNLCLLFKSHESNHTT